MAPIIDVPVPATAAGAASRDRSRLDRFVGLKRDNADPWIARYTDQIRILLPLVALAVVLIGIIGPMFGEATGLLVRQMPIEANRRHYMRMDRPHFAGSDKNQRPYTVTADHATQRTRDDKTYDLFRPKADLLDKQERWTAVTADTGKYDQRLRLLDLAGNVTVIQDKGYTLTTERARIDLDASAAFGDRPVRGHGPDGEVEAEGFHASERGDRLVFTGRTRLILKGHSDTSEPGSTLTPEPLPAPPPKGE